MDFLIDVHLPISLSKFLDKQSGCTSIHVNQILQKWHTSDAEISKYADENDFVVITKDSDFKNSHFIKNTPKKIIRITLGNVTNERILLMFIKYMPFVLPLAIKSKFYVEISNEQIIIIE